MGESHSRGRGAGGSLLSLCTNIGDWLQLRTKKKNKGPSLVKWKSAQQKDQVSQLRRKRNREAVATRPTSSLRELNWQRFAEDYGNCRSQKEKGRIGPPRRTKPR